MRVLSSSRWPHLQPWLERLIDIDASQQRQWLECECTDAELREELNLLLDGDGEVLQALDRIHQGMAMQEATIGQQVGPFEVLRRIGEGGMSVVYLARRRVVDYEQQVALKLLRWRIGGSAEIERFRREQSILARLNNPGIARLIEGGTSADGVPYLAMEMIDGVPITEYCDARKLSLRDRLILFGKVCASVAYAHRNLVVHRDLKPSNVFVDADGEPRLLDFGIAKLVHGDSADEECSTQTMQLTPGYAAPEQFSGGAVTTATDVYALGVLLHELVAGKRPPRSDGVEAGAVSGLADIETARCRGLELRALRRALEGDLDAIVACALRHDAERRYPDASALGEDIQRHLADRAVRARAGVHGYRLGRFLKRNRVVVVLLSALLAVLGGSLWFSARQAGYARQQAERAQQESARVAATQSFLVSLFEGAAPDTQATDDSVDALIARGLESGESRLGQQPQLQIEVLMTLGDIQRRRAHPESARAPLQRALALSRQHLGNSDPLTLSAARQLALVLDDVGDYVGTVQLLEPSLRQYRQGNGPEDAAEVRVLNALSRAHARLRELPKAIAAASESVRISQHLPAQDPRLRSEAMSVLGVAHYAAGDAQQAIEPLRASLQLLQASLGSEHADTAMAMSALAQPLSALGRLDEAERYLREALAIQQRTNRGIATPRDVVTVNDLAGVLNKAGRIGEAADLAERAVAMSRQLNAGDHPELAIYLNNLGSMRYWQGRLDDSARQLEESLRMYQATGTVGHPNIARVQQNLARTRVQQRQFEAARVLLDTSEAADRERYGAGHRIVGRDLLVRAQLALMKDENVQAALLAQEASVALASESENSPYRFAARHLQVQALLRKGEADAALGIALQHLTPGAIDQVAAVQLALAHVDVAEGACGSGAMQSCADSRRKASQLLAQLPEQQHLHADEARQGLARLGMP